MNILTNQDLALRSHDISVGLGNKIVPEFEALPEIGQMVRLALHIRGLPLIEYNVLRLVAYHYLQIHPSVIRQLVKNLAEVEFVRIFSEGDTIQAVLPTVPYYDDLYTIAGEFALTTKNLNEAEQLSLTILNKLSSSPLSKDNLVQLGAESRLLDRSINIGNQGNYLITKRTRGKDIVLSPVFFSENADVYADLVAKSGAKSIQKILNIIKTYQGYPLSLIEQRHEINGVKLSPDEVNLLKTLASDGAVKPPSITTTHAGVNHFIFTPTPGSARLSVTKREIYERAMALVSAVRQGQFLPNKYAIRYPAAILHKLKSSPSGLRANTEAFEQYKKLTVLKVGMLEAVGGGFYNFKLNQTPENYEAVDIALSLVSGTVAEGLEIDDAARIALGQDQLYVESLVGSSQLREQEQLPLSEDHQAEVDNLFLGGA